MKTKPTTEQIATLPKWAQEHIKSLDRRVVISERTLQEYCDTQTKSPFFYEELLCFGGETPQFVRKYIQTYGISVIRDGVRVDILLRHDESGIEVSWGSDDRLIWEIPMIPVSHQKIKIVPRDKLR